MNLKTCLTDPDHTIHCVQSNPAINVYACDCGATWICLDEPGLSEE